MDNIVIRPARPEDADALAKCISAAYAKYAGRITDLPDVSAGLDVDILHNKVWVAVDDGRIVGGLVMVLDGDSATIANLAVDPNMSGHGIGRRLLHQGEVECDNLNIGRLNLATHVKMPENVAFYQRLNWQTTGQSGNKIFMSKVRRLRDRL